MYDPAPILDWLTVRVKAMRRSRRKTLAAIVAAAMRMRGIGVLSLGRAMAGAVGAKHCIKRVWRFLRNGDLEIEALSEALLAALVPKSGPIVVLVDWTDLNPFQQLVFALPRDGRALPFLSKTIFKATGTGSVANAEKEALACLARIVPPGRALVVVADRGFGHTRWIADITNRGWDYVQRVSGTLMVDLSTHVGAISELGIARGSRPHDWGTGTLTDENPTTTRCVSVFADDAKEPWVLVTSLADPPPSVVRIYQRRMWIEAAFRDWKNRNWGMGLDACRLSQPQRHDRLFLVLALAYAFLSAFGAAAETLEIDRLLKANTVSERVMNLARLGVYFLQLSHCSIDFALAALLALPP